MRQRRLLVWALSLALPACTVAPSPVPSPTPAPAGSSYTLRGRARDAGFGSRLAFTGRTLAVGAPFAAEVYFRDVAVATGPAASFLGAGLCALSSGFLVGAPGTGELRQLNLSGHSTVVASLGPGSGGVLGCRGARVAASTPTGVATFTIDGRGNLGNHVDVTLPGKPSALGWTTDGLLVAGFLHGPNALSIGTVLVPRDSEIDEEGYALAVVDLDGNGTEEVVAGAPGAGVVRVRGRSGELVAEIGTGSGRFGASVVVGDLAAEGAQRELWIGAPMAGSEGNGAVHRYRAGVLESFVEGAPGDQLGTAIALLDDALAMGAPGLAESPGTVVVRPVD
jgi:hypothetical protein